MIKVSIIGFGNVAQHLTAAFEQSAAVELVQVYSRNKISVPNSIIDLNNLAVADVYIISVSDTAIAEVSSQLPFTNRLVVHTSGSMPLLETDSKNRRGVFYPLQTFSKERKVDFKSIPICIEAEFSEDLIVLKKLAKALSDSVLSINSTQRKALHVAAVFANNFTNHLLSIAEDICIQNKIPFNI